MNVIDQQHFEHFLKELETAIVCLFDPSCSVYSSYSFYSFNFLLNFLPFYHICFSDDDDDDNHDDDAFLHVTFL